MGQFTTCFALLVGVAAARATVALIIEKFLHKEVPPGMMFPMWEGPVFLTQYLAICESMSGIVVSRCYWHKILVAIVLGLIPGFFMIFAFIRLRKHMKAGTIAYRRRPQPASFKEAWTECKQKDGMFYKLLYIIGILKNRTFRGDWRDDNVIARRWSFMINDYTGYAWLFGLYTLFRKTLFALITTLLDGRINAICSLVLQSVDTVLLILYRPLANKEGLFLEISGGITNLLAFVNICAPIIFGELAAWPSWMDDTFTVMTGLFATVLGAVFSLVGAISSLVAPLCALKNVLWSYCLFPSCCHVFLPSCCQGALVEEILDIAPDSDEIMVIAKLNIAGEIDGQLADRAMNYEAFSEESNNEAMIGVTPSVVGGGLTAAAGVGTAAHQYSAGAGAVKEARSDPIYIQGVAAHQYYNLQYKLHAIITMSLDIDYKSIGEEGCIDRVFFNNDLKRDLSRASARLPPDCFEIRKLSKLSPGPLGVPWLKLLSCHNQIILPQWLQSFAAIFCSSTMTPPQFYARVQLLGQSHPSSFKTVQGSSLLNLSRRNGRTRRTSLSRRAGSSSRSSTSIATNCTT